jgi:formate hydrogenlyase subunit 3/multisubunit Na+/H+ antiporter MnhD subunit
MFSITHAILSALFFFLIDVVYRLYYTRSTYNLTGLLYLTPVLGSIIFINNIMYAGLPFTIKFYVEMYVYQFLLDVNILNLIFILFLVNFVSIISLAKL